MPVTDAAGSTADVVGSAATSLPAGVGSTTDALTVGVAPIAGAGGSTGEGVMSAATPVTDAIGTASPSFGTAFDSGAAAPIDAGATVASGGHASTEVATSSPGVLPWPELALPLHALAGADARLVLGGLLASALAAKASGIGIADFDRVLLRSCAADIRYAFRAVRLLPCPAGASGGPSLGASGGGTASGSARRPRSAPFEPVQPGNPLEPTPRGARAAALPLTWEVPGAGALRWVAATLAAISSAVAGWSAARHERQARRQSVYRARFHA
jgi:hypothetical protein